jgi:hypothetical protein
MNKYLLSGLFVVASVTSGCGSEGPQGPAGKDGTGNPSISAVFPQSLFAARTDTVLIAAVGTDFSEVKNPAVSFGAGVTVSKVTVASPTALLVDIAVSATAADGKRDVEVKQEGTTLTLKGAFEVDHAVKVKAVRGTLAQGSVAILQIANVDFANPFDTTSTGDGVFTEIEYTNFKLGAVPAGTKVTLNSVSEYKAELLVLMDVDADTKGGDLVLKSGPTGKEVDVIIPAGLAVAERKATNLVNGTPSTGEVKTAYESGLFTFAPASADKSVVEFTVASSNADASPALLVLPKSGKFTDMLGGAAAFVSVTTSTDPFYAVLWENAGAVYDYSLVGRSTKPAFVANEAASHANVAAAQPITALPALIENAKIAKSKAGYFKVVVTGEDAKKKLFVATLAGDKEADPVLQLVDGSDKAIGKAVDKSAHETMVTGALEAGTYFIKVTPSTYDSSYVPAAGSEAYTLFVRFE